MPTAKEIQTNLYRTINFISYKKKVDHKNFTRQKLEGDFAHWLNEFVINVGGVGGGTWGSITGLVSDQAEYGAPLGLAPLDAAGKLPVSMLPTSAMEFKGAWDALTNIPALASGVGTNGDTYLINVAGTTNLDGEAVWGSGDLAVFNGALGIWQRSPAGSLNLINGSGTTVNGTTLDLGGTLTGPASINGAVNPMALGVNAVGENLSFLAINAVSVQVKALNTYGGGGVGTDISINEGEFSVINNSNPTTQTQLLTGALQGELSYDDNRIATLQINAGGIPAASGESFTIQGVTVTEGVDFTGQGSQLLDATTIAGLDYSGGGLNVPNFVSVVDEGFGQVKFVSTFFGAVYSETLTNAFWNEKGFEARFVINPGEIAMSRGDSASPSKLSLTNTVHTFTDTTSLLQGIQYAADYSATFADESLISKRYGDSNIAGQSVHTTISGIGAPEDGRVICWDDTNSRWDMCSTVQETAGATTTQALTRWDSTNGTLVKNSNITLDDNANLRGLGSNGMSFTPNNSQKAITMVGSSTAPNGTKFATHGALHAFYPDQTVHFYENTPQVRMNVGRAIVRIEAAGSSIGSLTGLQGQLQLDGGGILPLIQQDGTISYISTGTDPNTDTHNLWFARGVDNSVDLLAHAPAQDELDTTDATPTVLRNIVLGFDDTKYLIEVTVTAIDDAQAVHGSWTRLLSISKIAGTAVIELENAIHDEQTGALTPSSLTLAVNAGNIDASVTGIAATNIRWNSAVVFKTQTTNA